MSDKTFVEGLYPREKHANAPDFVLCKLSINVQQHLAFLNAYAAANPGEEWLRADLKISKAGKGYAELDTWKPNTQSDGGQVRNQSGAIPVDDAAREAFRDDDIPF